MDFLTIIVLGSVMAVFIGVALLIVAAVRATRRASTRRWGARGEAMEMHTLASDVAVREHSRNHHHHHHHNSGSQQHSHHSSSGSSHHSSVGGGFSGGHSGGGGFSGGHSGGGHH